jgi:hypothetical protein
VPFRKSQNRGRRLPIPRAASALFLLAAVFIPGVQPLNAQVAFKTAGGDHIAIDINGQPFSTFYVGSSYPKPFLAPLRTATGVIMTRKFPMENVDAESRDHPHHRGLFVGFHDVNGINFWENEFTYKTPNRGRIVTRHIDEVTPGKKSGRIIADFEWRDPAGSDMIDEHRIMTFSGDAGTRTIDIDITLNDNHPPRWHSRAYGLFAVNPFMVKDVDPKSTEQGGYTMAAGSSLHFRYRVIVHAGDVPMKTVASWYTDYKKKAK